MSIKAGDLVAKGQQAVGKAASHPKLGNALRSYSREAERCEFNVGDATGEGFARLAKSQGCTELERLHIDSLSEHFQPSK